MMAVPVELYRHAGSAAGLGKITRSGRGAHHPAAGEGPKGRNEGNARDVQNQGDWWSWDEQCRKQPQVVNLTKFE